MVIADFFFFFFFLLFLFFFYMSLKQTSVMSGLFNWMVK